MKLKVLQIWPTFIVQHPSYILGFCVIQILDYLVFYISSFVRKTSYLV